MRRIVVLAAALGLAACSRIPPPEEVARAFYQVCEVAPQEGFDSVQGPLYSMVSESSRKLLDECAGRLAGRIGDGPGETGAKQPPYPPHTCLVFQKFTGKRGDFEARRVAEGPMRVRLEITSGSKVRLLELVNEDGWKIDLEASAELNSGK